MIDINKPIYKVVKIDDMGELPNKKRWPSLLGNEPGFLVAGPYGGQSKTLYTEAIANEICTVAHVGFLDGFDSGRVVGSRLTRDVTVELLECAILMLRNGKGGELETLLANATQQLKLDKHNEDLEGAENG